MQLKFCNFGFAMVTISTRRVRYVLQWVYNATECKHFRTLILIYSVGRKYIISKYDLNFFWKCKYVFWLLFFGPIHKMSHIKQASLEEHSKLAIWLVLKLNFFWKSLVSYLDKFACWFPYINLEKLQLGKFLQVASRETPQLKFIFLKTETFVLLTTWFTLPNCQSLKNQVSACYLEVTFSRFIVSFKNYLLGSSWLNNNCLTA